MSASDILIVLGLLLVTGIGVVGATDHIVGANKGWNPGINYTLWANNQTFYPGDFISFRYQKNQYNVYRVNETGYDNCTMDGAFGNWTSGKDFILLTEAKRYYFICGTGGCFNGMKVSVLVHSVPSSSNSTNHTSDNQDDSAARSITMVSGSSFLLLLLSLILWFILD